MSKVINHSEQAETNRLFADWLTGAYGSHFECKPGNYHIAIIRIHKNDAFDYLFCRRSYRSTGIERGEKFEYVGIYCKADGLLYDVKSDIRDLLSEDDDYETRSAQSLSRHLMFHVCRAVEKMVGNDRNHLRITELHSEHEIKDMENFKMYSAAGAARKAFLEGDDDFAFNYECPYRPENWTEDSLLEYITDPNGYAEREAAAYFDEKQEDILSEFLMSDMVTAEYGILINNPTLPVHRVKRIIQAMEQTSAKTINVTVRINGTELTFKTEAREFRSDCTSTYSDWNIVASDRREFERVFGQRARYGPEDIIRIEYARSVLYSAESIGG